MNTYHATVTITLRKGILDVQGKTVEHALHASSFSTLTDVRIGKHVEMTVTAASTRTFCWKATCSWTAFASRFPVALCLTRLRTPVSLV